MPIVVSSVSIADFSPAQIWPVLIDFSNFPRVMENVRSVQILDQTDNGMTAAWEVELDGAVFAWTERDTFDAPRELRFEQIEGDLECWSGFWKLEQTATGTEVTLEVEFGIGIPSMEPFLNPLAETAIQENSEQLLEALKRSLDAKDHNEVSTVA